MKKGIGNILSIGIIIIGLSYITFIIIKRNNLENELKKTGVFFFAKISKEFIGKQSSRQYTYIFQIGKRSFTKNLSVSVSYFDKHKLGDTIIIKFSSNNPEKSMIIECKEYKSCYGIPPINGWKELPKCK